jgi:hypothetical protein
VNITAELLEARMVSDENLRNFLRDYPEGVELRTFSDFEKPSIQVLRPLWFELLTADAALSSRVELDEVMDEIIEWLEAEGMR